MTNLIYDGSFIGLLSALHESFTLKGSIGKIASEEIYQQSLLDENITVASNPEKAKKLMYAVKVRISREALTSIFYVYLSEHKDAGTMLYNFLDLGWKEGGKTGFFLSDSRVIDVNNIQRKVLFEYHRMLGLIRFRHLKDDVYYAPMEPDHNITGLLVPHFLRRLPCENWIIHDVGRDIAALHFRDETCKGFEKVGSSSHNNWTVTHFEMDGSPAFDDDEEFYQALWKRYFTSCSIQSRTSPKPQKRNMPARYWKYLIEMSDK
jgi:probable DNA metabolism protein